MTRLRIMNVHRHAKKEAFPIILGKTSFLFIQILQIRKHKARLLIQVRVQVPKNGLPKKNQVVAIQRKMVATMVVIN